MSFNAVLCYVNTRVTGISSGHIVGAEMFILSLAFLASVQSLNRLYLAVIAATILYILTLSLIRANVSPEKGIDVKIIRDFLIPIAFFMLGTRVRDLRAADRTVWLAIIIVAPVAALEYFDVETFLKYFNVIRYYVARGTFLGTEEVLNSSGNLATNAIRSKDQGRELLSFLGDHRLSSIFLEPIGLACFGIIVFIWGVVRSRFEHKFHIGLVSAGLLYIILADSRFGAVLSVFILILIMLPLQVSTIIVAILPGFSIISLLIAGQLVHSFPTVLENTLSGRLIYSSQVLTEFDFYQWLGIKVSQLQTFDAGYGYIISGIGLFGLVAFWYIFLSIPGPSRQFYWYRNACAAYFATMSCIGAAQFTIKTASLLWFLLGALSAAHEEAGSQIAAKMRPPSRSGLRIARRRTAGTSQAQTGYPSGGRLGFWERDDK
jgi:putative polymerase